MRIIKSQRNIAASYMPPNPYDIGPSDPKEYKVADTSNYELNVQFDDPIIIYDDGDFEFTSDKYNLDPAPDSTGEYKDEEYNVNVIDADTLYDIIYGQLIQKHVTEKYPSGRYRVTGIITLQFDIDGVEYDEEFYGIDEDGDPDYSRDYYADNADAKLVSLDLTSLNITAEINSASDIIVSADDEETWDYLKSKQVTDSDGMLTDYTLYVNSDGSRYICMFGDNDVYEPDPAYADWEGDSEEEAYEWFNNYTSGYEDEDDIYGATNTSTSAEYAGERNYDGTHVFLVRSPLFDNMTYENMLRDMSQYRVESTGYSDTLCVYAEPDEKQGVLDLIEDFNQNISDDNIISATDVDYEDDIQEIGQEFTSENTSINNNRLPAVFNMVSFEPGTVNIDYGGGKFDNVAEYLTQYDVVNLVYDLYNRTAEHNKEVIRLVREHGGADTATCSNVLNVIKEPEVRLNVLNNIKKLVKPNGKVYITVYEGKGNNAEGPTKYGYQLNRKTAEYMDEIQQVFPDAKRKGKLIVATNSSGSVTSATNESCYDNNSLTTL